MKNQYLFFIFSLCIISFVGMIWYFYPSEKIRKNPPIPSEISSVSTFDTKGKSGTSMNIDPTQTGLIDTNRGIQNKTHSGFIFQKPNTDWKERDVTLNDGRTLHYVFGEGNPKEVVLDKEGINHLYETCKDVPDSTDKVSNNPDAKKMWNLGFCDSESGRPRYMSVDVEKYLYDALNDPSWKVLATECRKNLQFIETRGRPSDVVSMQKNGEDTFDQVFSSGFLDIENFISIDKETGWKKLNMDKIYPLVEFLERGKRQYGRGETLVNPYGDCVDRTGSGIIQNFQKAFQGYSVSYGMFPNESL